MSKKITFDKLSAPSNASELLQDYMDTTTIVSSKPPEAFTIRDSNDEIALRIKNDGNVEFGPGFNGDQTIKDFWQAISNMNPYWHQDRAEKAEKVTIKTSHDNAKLEQENYKLRQAFQKATAQLVKAHKEGWLEEIPEPEKPTYVKLDDDTAYDPVR